MIVIMVIMELCVAHVGCSRVFLSLMMEFMSLNVGLKMKKNIHDTR